MPLERNHRVKLLRGYGMGITLKENQIILKNAKYFYEKNHEIESYFPSRFPYERKTGMKKENGLSNCAEITIAKISIQNLADFCIGKQSTFSC